MQLRIYQLKRRELIEKLLRNSRATSSPETHAHIHHVIALSDIQGKNEDEEISDKIAQERLAPLEKLLEHAAEETTLPLLTLPHSFLSKVATKLDDPKKPNQLSAFSETCGMFRRISQPHRNLLRTVFLKMDANMFSVQDVNMIVRKTMINFLKEKNIHSVSLFVPATTFSKDQLAKINGVIEYLKAHGIAVQRVITPADYVWHINESTLENFHDQCAQHRPGKTVKLLSNDDQFVEIRETLEDPSFCELQPGMAFTQVSQNFKLWSKAFWAQFVLPKVCPALHKNLEDYLVEHFMAYYGKYVSQLDIVEMNDGQPVSTTYIKNGERAFCENRSKCVIC